MVLTKNYDDGLAEVWTTHCLSHHEGVKLMATNLAAQEVDAAEVGDLKIQCVHVVIHGCDYRQISKVKDVSYLSVIRFLATDGKVYKTVGWYDLDLVRRAIGGLVIRHDGYPIEIDFSGLKPAAELSARALNCLLQFEQN